MMDATVTAVIRLREQGCSIAEIARRVNVAHTKVTQILVTAGLYETEEARLYAQGLSVPEIAEKLGKSEKAVFPRVPYSKGMYNAEYPSTNALKIRTSRRKEKENDKI